ncbi:hypothetical protein KKC74_12855 [bacterium]|nr:hypothetical protein [bacterium]
MPTKPFLHILIIISFLSIVPHAAESDSSAYQPINAAELLLLESNLVVASFDDWGLNGSLSSYGLPEYSVQIKFNDFTLSDPLYGSIPMSWINPRQQSVGIDPFTDRISLTPVFADSGTNLSRFDYYRGDYGFNNFSAILAGNIAENIYWRLYGEKLGYDGAYGLLGPDLYNLKESVIQNFFLDVQKLSGPWQFDIGSSYQKYFPGLTTPSVRGVANGETFLNWTHAGRMKEYRTNFYISGTRSNSNGSLKTGIQLTNFMYNTTNDSSVYVYSAEAFQYSGRLRWDFNAANGMISLEILPLLESVYLKQPNYKKRTQFKQSIAYSAEGTRFDYCLRFGSTNSNPTADLTAHYLLSKKLFLDLRSALEYVAYPLSYYTDIGGITSDRPDADGFSAFRQSIGFRYQFGNNHIQSRLDFSSADFLIPSKSIIESSSYTLQKRSLKQLYLTEEFYFDLPWRFTLKGRTIFSPSTKDDSNLLFQGWSRITKDLFLFKDNLHIYLSGDMYYLTGSNSVVWFEQLRTQAQTDIFYYTNERLSVGGIAGARIGPFHIFYSVYNAEGRAFSALPGVLYRNRLKVFGIDWTFTN